MQIIKESKIAILCGGISPEREISLKSGSNCFNALKGLGYKNLALIDVKSIDDLILLKEQKFEICFVILHGQYGEDGTTQGVLDWLGIPYTGSSVLGSAISMDKWLTKQIAAGCGINAPASVLLSNSQNVDLLNIWEKLSQKSGHIFLKPRAGGSSVDTFKLNSINALNKIIKTIDLSKQDFLIEEAISGREVTVSLIEIDSKLKVLPILELKSKNEFYDYKAKYTKGMTEFILPAKLSDDLVKRLEQESVKIFTECCCSSFGRVDFIIEEKSEIPYFLEINSLPGMTDISDLPAQAQCAGIGYTEVVEIILKTAKLHKSSCRISEPGYIGLK